MRNEKQGWGGGARIEKQLLSKSIITKTSLTGALKWRLGSG